MPGGKFWVSNSWNLKWMCISATGHANWFPQVPWKLSDNSNEHRLISLKLLFLPTFSFFRSKRSRAKCWSHKDTFLSLVLQITILQSELIWFKLRRRRRRHQEEMHLNKNMEDKIRKRCLLQFEDNKKQKEKNE